MNHHPSDYVQRARTVRTLTLLAALGLAVTGTGRAEKQSAPIPLSEIGAKATADYQGEALGVAATGEGARLRCGFQRLEGRATVEGLWLESTAAGGGRLRMVAASVRREGAADGSRGSCGPLSATGTVAVAEKLVRFIRPGLVEEYSASVDGMRQDFVVMERPAGMGELRVELGLSGARAEAAGYGARLRLEGSGRELAYSRLRALDAQGRQLLARLEVTTATRLAVVVDDAAAAYPIRIDPTFSDADWISLGNCPGASGTVFAAAADGSGNLYIGGEFTSVGDVIANCVAKWDGSAWSALGSGWGFVGSSPCVLVLAVSGTNLYAGGWFTTAGGTPANYIAKWNGSAWSALGSGLDDAAEAVAVSGSTVYAGGRFTTAGGITVNRIAKWDGSAWSALGSGLDDAAEAVAVSGTNLYAGGGFTRAGGITVNGIAKWDGSAWSGLGSGMGGSYPYVYALAVSGTNLYAGGEFTTAGGITVNGIAKWNGSAWSGLGSGMGGGYPYVLALAVSGSTVYAGGRFTTAGGITVNYIAKWNGSAWSALGSGMGGGYPYVLALAVSGTNLYAGGGFTTAAGIMVRGIATWNGSTWGSAMSLGSGLSDSVVALAVSGTNLYAGGEFTTAAGSTINYIAKWNGSAWSGLGSGMGGRYSHVYALAVSGTNLYAGGEFTTAGGITVNGIARWDGSTWSGLGSGMGGSYPCVSALAVSGANLYAGGWFTTAGGTPANYIAKWNGSAWSALSSGLNDAAEAVAVSGSTVYAGGRFTTAGGITVNGIAKWDGSAWSALGSGMEGDYPYVLALAVSGTNLYAGGWFTTAGGTAASGIARWNGSAWSALGSGVNAEVSALAVSGTNLYAGGWFTTAGGITVNGIAKWDGSAWSALGSGVNAEVSALAVSGTNLYAGGNFTTAGNKVCTFVAMARLWNPQVTVQSGVPGCSFTVDGTNYTSAQAFTWSAGSSHTLTTTSPQSGGAGTQYVWTSWSDGGGRSHTIAPTAATTYTASFKTQYSLTMSAGSGGAVSPSSGWYDAGANVGISNAPWHCYQLTSWTGGGSGSYSGTNGLANVTLNGPVSEVAAFALATYRITTTNSPWGSGRSSGGGTWSCGTSVTVAATSNSGCRFVNWTEAGVVVATNNPYTFTAAADRTLVANFSDIQAPTITVTSPSNGQRSSNAVFTVKGTAKDNAQVASVWSQLNGGNWSKASSTNSWTNWTATVSLIPGTNSLKAYAVDAAGNQSTTTSVSLVYVLSDRLTLRTNPPAGGTVSGVSGGQWLEINRSYTATAKSNGAAGFVFRGWTRTTNGLNWTTSTVPALSFTMQSNLVLVAHFADVQKPTLTLTNPPANSRLSNSIVNVMGTAKDNDRVTNVWVSLNAAAFLPAGTQNHWTNWALLQQRLAPGTNVVRAYAADATGNLSQTVTNRVVYVLSDRLVLRTNPPAGGTVSGVSSGQWLELNHGYTATAKSNGIAGFVFRCWTRTTNGVNWTTSTVPALSFIMQSNLVLVAHFSDVRKPVLTLTNPPANSRLSNSVVNVMGTAKDNDRVTNVWVSLNAAAFLPAGTQNNWTNWALQQQRLAPGTNVVRAYAADATGNASQTVTNRVVYVASDRLVVRATGPVALSPNYSNAVLEVGKSYSMTATPGSGYVLSNWVGSVLGNTVLSTNAPKLSFLMRSNLVLQANVIRNPFIPAKGAYNGLFSATPRRQDRSGLFTLTLTDQGAYSGSLQAGTNRYALSGQFDLAGTASKTVIRPKTNPWQLSMQLDFGVEQLQGTVSNGVVNGWVAELLAERAVFSRTNPAPYAGKYTLVIPGLTNADGTVALGDGYAVLTVDTNGGVSLSGSLADGTALIRPSSQNPPVSRDGYWPLYVPLYTGKGSVWGWPAFETNQASPGVEGGLSWIKLAGAGGKYYPQGLTNEVMVEGSRYSPPLGATNRVMALTNGVLLLEGGHLSVPLTNFFLLTQTNKVIDLSVTNRLTLTLTVSNGLFNGKIRVPETGKTNAFNGVVLQNEAVGSGYFLGTNQSGRVSLEPQ